MRVAIVTGAAGGIGAAIAKRLVLESWRVVAVDSNERALNALVGVGPGLRGYVADISDDEAVTRLMADIGAREGRLDALVSNAGLMIRKPIAALSPAEWARVLGTNLTATFLLVRAGEHMLRTAKGAVVTIASTRATMSEPDTEAYAASKGGLVALSHALAMSLGPEVRVNSVCPGWIDTAGGPLRPEDHAQHPAGRVGRPEDVASLVSWLLSPEQGFVTGSSFVLDGGMTRKMIYLE
jgi:NAD(P)-dependent dehydrogenase (short-subunit alcohol dehydrogenase family)